MTVEFTLQFDVVRYCSMKATFKTNYIVWAMETSKMTQMKYGRG